MAKIEIFGTGCPKCKALEKNVKKAVEDLGIKADVIKVQSIQEITDRGIIMTPALYVNGEPKAVGRVPNVEEIKKILKA
ncbi:MAG: thioredoxin family protein [archaeon]